MHAIVSTWRLHESVQAGAEGDEFLRDFLARGIEIVRRAGVLDVLMILVKPDQLVIVSVYETLQEAEAANPLTRQFVAEHFAGKLAPVSRLSGPAYDPPQLVAIDRLDAQRWRDEAEAMHAELITWRLDPSLGTSEALVAFLHQIWERSLRLLKRRGLLDVLVVQTARNEILAIRLYGDPVTTGSATEAAREVVKDMLAGKVEFVEKRTGRALDVPHLLR